ncbi:MAG: DUF4332 domain-containing protein [Anaerolineae bacterium]|nr:DUF4332 domain-containing protein [Anaerolineae bacterium]
MTIRIQQLKGITNELTNALKAQGFFNSDQLLDAARTPLGRKLLAEQVGVDPRIILELANRADLARICGIGSVFSNLLEHAGVDTVKELANRRPGNLYDKLAETNSQKELAGRAPTFKAVEDWVAQAKSLPPKLEY